MKNLLVLIFSSVTLFAGQEHIYLERMANMQEMEKAMATIQKGFLYNNVNVVKNGVKDLKSSAEHTESFMKNDIGINGINNMVYAKKEAAAISVMADEILATFEKGDQYRASNNYLLILSKCLSCHKTVRSW